jgi:hypothetical protein
VTQAQVREAAKLLDDVQQLNLWINAIAVGDEIRLSIGGRYVPISRDAVGRYLLSMRNQASDRLVSLGVDPATVTQ